MSSDADSGIAPLRAENEGGDKHSEELGRCSGIRTTASHPRHRLSAHYLKES
jgi:hypothetical protein